MYIYICIYTYIEKMREQGRNRGREREGSGMERHPQNIQKIAHMCIPDRIQQHPRAPESLCGCRR